MAQKRMFDRAIIDTDRFMDLSMSAKALYFLLGMEADDEGFVSYKKVMRIHGGNEDDVKILVVKNFLIAFESGVVVITDWNKNNWLDDRRTKPTEYKKERDLLVLTEEKEYVLSTCLVRGEERRVEERSIDMSVSFENFWKVYPRKELKKRSKEIWEKKKLYKKETEIVVFVEKALLSDRWKKGFIKQPPAFLNGECWNDDLASYQDHREKGLVLKKY